MGQGESKEEKEPKSPKRSGSNSYHRGEREVSHGKQIRRPAGGGAGGSSHGGSNPPPATLMPSSSSASTSTSTAHAHATTVSHSPSHGRARSITSNTPRLPHDDPASSQKSDRSSYMGQAESKDRQRPPSRSQTLPIPAPSEKPAASPSSQPVDVPQSNDGLNEKEQFEPSGVPDDSLWAPPVASRFDRPPRLPLPIEEEAHTPGSPIISPTDVHSPLGSEGINGALPRRSSVISSTTADDDEIDPSELFDPEQPLQPTVPSTITWRGDADKVYVTGTFVNWERKFRLHQDKEHGGFSATLQLRPGTHHLKFLVGGDMITSDDLPTTVDYTNILVNYIEVVAPLPQTEEQPPTPAEPMPIPGAALTAGQATATAEPAARPMDIRTKTHAPETADDIPSTLHETIPPDVTQPARSTQPAEPLPTPTPQKQPPRPQAPPRQRIPRARYTSEIPSFLTDLDANNAEDDRFHRAKRVEQHLPQPPSLPMFLSKSILNGQMPHKDDASVLLMPNHTVLNHLATSSIKSGVLATSGTTRYKRKFLTTIMYKPTSAAD